MDQANSKDNKHKNDISILVVDDREDNLLSIETILENDQYHVVKANSGRAALKILLHQHDFSLILMDVHMPDMNGFETASIIYERDKLKNIPVIFITAYSNDEEYVFKGYGMGGVDYIYKPISPELLRVKVGLFVELYRKTHQLMNQEKKLLAANRSLQKEIEERRRSEEKVRLLNEQLLENNTHLKAVNEELDRFAYVASHDLQEPLRKIMVFSDRIMSKKDDRQEVEKYLAKISNSSHRMQSLINNLLQFSRYTVNPADFVVVDLNEQIKEALEELEIEIEKNDITVSVGQMPVIYAVPSLMRQLFYNLANNAIRFRQKDKPSEIHITAEKIGPLDRQVNGRYASDINYYKISVADNGIGFDPKYTEDIFAVFKRLHSSHEFEGAGVGLSICKKIVEKHHGFITARGVPYEGATFIIELPEQIPVPGPRPSPVQ